MSDPTSVVTDGRAVSYGASVYNDDELRVCGDVKGKRVLELGLFGTVPNCVAMAQRGARSIAIDPSKENVQRALADRKDRPIAMFCTGGIRCEKATSYLREQGFEKVYHLKGGILRYLETIPPEHSLWRGSCFVFDEREGLGHGLEIIRPAG